MNYEWHYSQKDALDHKITKRYFPRTNNESVLEFIFDKDPNLYLRKNCIRVRGSIEVNNEFLVDTGFVAKLFSMLTIEVNSQTISSNRNRYVIFLLFKINICSGVNISWRTICRKLGIFHKTR